MNAKKFDYNAQKYHFVIYYTVYKENKKNKTGSVGLYIVQKHIIILHGF